MPSAATITLFPHPNGMTNDQRNVIARGRIAISAGLYPSGGYPLSWQIEGIRSIPYPPIGPVIGGTAYVLSQVANAAAAGSPAATATVYTGTFTATSLVGMSVAISGFATAANNGTFVVVANTLTTMTVANAGGVAVTAAGVATMVAPVATNLFPIDVNVKSVSNPPSALSYLWDSTTGNLHIQSGGAELVAGVTVATAANDVIFVEAIFTRE